MLLLLSYVDFYRLPEPCDDIHVVLDSIGKRIGGLTKGSIMTGESPLEFCCVTTQAECMTIIGQQDTSYRCTEMVDWEI